MKSNILCVGIVSFMSLWVHVSAGEYPRTVRVHLGGSSSQNEFDWSDSGGSKAKVASPGSDVGLQFLHQIPSAPSLSAGVDLNYAKLSWEENQRVFPNVLNRSRFESTTLMAVLKWSKPEGTFRPFLFGTVGVHSTSFFLEIKPEEGMVWSDTSTSEPRDIVDGRGSSLAAGFGGGVDVYLSPRIFFGVELRATYLANANYGVTGFGESKDFTDAKGDLSFANLLLCVGTRF